MRSRIRLLAFRVIFTLSFVAIQVCPAPSSALAQNDQSGQFEKLTALARTYGYVRFFHPSDQASLVDWDLMAVYAAQQALESPADEPTDKLLERVFGPLVVDLDFYQGAEKPRPEMHEVEPDEVLAWQHIGVGMNAPQSIYSSLRTGRVNKIDKPAGPFGNVLQSVNPADLLGDDIRMRFQAKVDQGRCRLQGWMRVDRNSKKRGFFDNMGDRPIRDKEWQEYEIVGTVDEDAANITFGVMFLGNGSALVDNITLEHKKDDGWEDIEIKNPSFEEGKTIPAQWATRGGGYTFKIEKDDVADGNQAMRFGRGSVERRNLMEMVPNLGEVIDASLGDDLRVRMPLALPVDTTYSAGDSESTDQLINDISQIDPNKASQETLCVANVIYVWNVFQHFYPYFEQVETDWDAALQTSLKRAVESNSRQETLDTLKWLVAQLHDGHGSVFDPMAMHKRRILPVAFGWIENKLVVIASDDPEVIAGDIVTHIDGVEAETVLKQRDLLQSGSPQWKRLRSTMQLSTGENGNDLELKLKRGDNELERTLTFNKGKMPDIKKRDVIELIVEGDSAEDNIYYVDLGRAEPGEVRAKIEEFAKAKGIVFDLRGYPRGTQFLLQHMTDQHMQSQKWQVPKQVRPDRLDMKEFRTSGRWQMPPQTPRFEGKMVFLTNSSAISYAESVMSIVANYKLGEIVGMPTAGANGNVNPFQLPGGFRVSWTGMRVMNHDDSQHHVRGVQPTIPLEPTIQAVVEGRDEYVEKALELINGE